MLETINGQYIVIGVSLLILSFATTSQWIILAPALGGWSSPQIVTTLGPLNLGILILGYYYYMAIVTEPGKVPDGWEPPYSLIPAPEEVHANKGETGPRYCRSCDAYKPPRAHHCRVCRRCILKMDHHCPWINNCVGHGNYPYFFRFILFVSLTCGYALYLLIWRLMQIMDTNSLRNTLRPVTITEMIFMVYNVAGIFITVFAVSLLGLYHGYCVLNGQTTIEAWERSKVKSLIKRRKIEYVDFPYDLGTYRNIASVLGNNPLLWLFPRSSIGDGLSFTLRPSIDPKLPFYWPPRDPDDLRPSIFDKQQQQQQQQHRQQPHLIRRDSEGYLVREISIEERMRMLNNSVVESVEQQQQEEEAINLQQHNNNDTTFYYYDSGSESDGDYLDDRQQQQWMDDDGQWEDMDNSLETPLSLDNRQ
ncbi:DHHC palmitoyltransferase-domain-containing protein [Chlamydoabsidia padenii]|nr:DHHC palmitoyltransferase-domain-containing protein [Chlamydoabsidia padenii]